MYREEGGSSLPCGIVVLPRRQELFHRIWSAGKLVPPGRVKRILRTNMKKKRKISTLLAVLLLIVGLGVLLYPSLSDLYYRWEAEQEIAQYNQVAEATQEDYSDLWAAAEEYNRKLAQGNAFSVAATAEEEAKIEQFLNPLGNGMMGYIDIPKINVHLPIYQGIEEQALQAGVGFWPGTSLPTGGPSTHCVLTAHNGLVRAKMFTDLDQLVEGDTFSLSILDRVLTYEVDQILVTEPDEVDALQIVEGQDYVTLYTCTPYGVNTHRLLVRGHRIETPENVNLGNGAVDIIRTQSGMTVLITLAVVGLLILLFRIWRIFRARKKKQQT